MTAQSLFLMAAALLLVGAALVSKTSKARAGYISCAGLILIGIGFALEGSYWVTVLSMGVVLYVLFDTYKHRKQSVPQKDSDT